MSESNRPLCCDVWCCRKGGDATTSNRCCGCKERSCGDWATAPRLDVRCLVLLQSVQGPTLQQKEQRGCRCGHLTAAGAAGVQFPSPEWEVRGALMVVARSCGKQMSVSDGARDGPVHQRIILGAVTCAPETGISGGSASAATNIPMQRGRRRGCKSGGAASRRAALL